MFSKLLQAGLPFMKMKQIKARIISTYIIKDGLLSAIVDFVFMHFILGAFFGKCQLKSSQKKTKTKTQTKPLVQRETESNDMNVSNTAKNQKPIFKKSFDFFIPLNVKVNLIITAWKIVVFILIWGW